MARKAFTATSIITSILTTDTPARSPARGDTPSQKPVDHIEHFKGNEVRDGHGHP